MMATDPAGKLVSLDAERAVLGACLIDPDAVAKAAEELEASDFHDEGHRALFAAMVSLDDQGQAPDQVVLRDEMGADFGKLGCKEGGRREAYLTWLVNRTPTAMHAQRYASIVRRLSTLRRLVGYGARVAQEAYRDRDDLDDVFARARRWLDAIEPRSGEDEAVLYWEESLRAFFDGQLARSVEADEREEGLVRWVTFPWAGMRRYLSHLREGTLAIVAAEPGVGKTAFLEGMAEHNARQGLQVVFFHLELSHQIMIDRRTARHSGVPVQALEEGGMPDEAQRAQDALRAWPGGIHYVHCPRWSAPRIVRRAAALRQRGLCDLAIVDYLQKLSLSFENGANRAQALGHALEVLKSCREQLGIPFVVASQFSRGSRDRKVKVSDDIRDTGEAEDKANMIALLDRPRSAKNVVQGGRTVLRAGDRVPTASCRMDKNTLGAVGSFSLVFDGARFSFADSPSEATLATLEPPPLNF